MPEHTESAHHLLAKTGAEGIITAALPERGLGIAVEIADGGSRARSLALLAILDHLGELSDAHKQQLQAYIKPILINSRGGFGQRIVAKG